MLYLRLKNNYTVPDLKRHNCAKLTNTETCLKTPGLNMSSPCLLPWQHAHSKRQKYSFPALACFMTLGYIFHSVSPACCLCPYSWKLSGAPTMSHHRQDLQQGFSWHCSRANYPRSWLSNWGTVQISVLVCPNHTQSGDLMWIRDYLLVPIDLQLITKPSFSHWLLV